MGSALLQHSGPVPVKWIRKTACDAGIIPVLMGARGEILDVGRSQRTVPRAIRRALHARDKGCAFPGCTRPTRWTEAHHVIPWLFGGETSVANCCLLCSFHHHLIHRQEWEVTMTGGVPWFIPPATLDCQRRPRRNYYHDAPLRWGKMEP